LQHKAETGASVGEAQRALHVARAVDLDDAEAGMLLVIGAQPAVVRTALLDLASKGERNGARFVELALRGVGLGIAVDQRFETAMLGARLRMNTLPSRSTIWASTGRRQSGQMLRVSS